MRAFRVRKPTLVFSIEKCMAKCILYDFKHLLTFHAYVGTIDNENIGF